MKSSAKEEKKKSKRERKKEKHRKKETEKHRKRRNKEERKQEKGREKTEIEKKRKAMRAELKKKKEARKAEFRKKRGTIERRRIIEKLKNKKNIVIGFFSGLIASSILLLIYKSLIISIIGLFAVFGLFFLIIYFRLKLRDAAKIKKIESVFPDFLQLMASNLRAGITIDKAILLSSRPEFAPLDREILNVGKDIATGKSIEISLLEMSKRIRSEKIEKTVFLIISGIRAGGNLAILLEGTSRSMREREFVEKKAASNVLMYIIFIFVATSVGAPILFSLSSLLVETLTMTLSSVPSLGDLTYAGLPFTLSSINISINFIKYFSLVFIIVTDILAALVLGLISKGEERQGLKYIGPMIIISVVLFFIVRFTLSGFVKGLVG